MISESFPTTEVPNTSSVIFPINQVVFPRYVQSSIAETVTSTVPIILNVVEFDETM